MSHTIYHRANKKNTTPPPVNPQRPKKRKTEEDVRETREAWERAESRMRHYARQEAAAQLAAQQLANQTPAQLLAAANARDARARNNTLQRAASDARREAAAQLAAQQLANQTPAQLLAAANAAAELQWFNQLVATLVASEGHPCPCGNQLCPGQCNLAWCTEYRENL